MVIKAVKVYVVDTGSYRPVIVETLTDEGIIGIGEGAVGFGTGCMACATMIKELAPQFIIGKDPYKIRDIWNNIYAHTFWAKGGGPIFFAAVSALEMSLIDIKAKSLGIPVYDLLGGKQRDELIVYANDWSNQETPEEFADRAQKVVEDGYEYLKVYPLSQVDHVRGINLHIKNRNIPPETEERCYAIVRNVREAIGYEKKLMVDFTCEGTKSTMIRIMKNLEEYDPFWYEEPGDSFDLDVYEEIKEKTHIAIAAGERCYTRYGIKPLIQKRSVDIVQPDPGTCGGILEAWQIAAMAEVNSMSVAFHNCGGPVLTAAAVQLAASASNFICQEVFPYRPEIHYDILENPLEKTIKKGKLKVPETPGFGVRLNEKLLSKYLVADIKDDL